MREADLIIDIGPGSGTNGGEIVGYGTAYELAVNPKSHTGYYLTEKMKATLIRTERKDFTKYIEIKGARANNLKGISARIPLNCLTAVTGVSGSGKSTLINDVLYNKLAAIFTDPSIQAGELDEIKGFEQLRGVVMIDQTPIGKSSRSNPATYIEIYDSIRKLFSSTPKA